MEKLPVHTIEPMGDSYKVTRVKAPSFTAMYKDGELYDIVFVREPIGINKESLFAKALAFVNSHLTMQAKG